MKNNFYISNILQIFTKKNFKGWGRKKQVNLHLGATKSLEESKLY